MSVLAPPEPPHPDELEALIPEARARQRKRWLGAVVAVALLAGAATAINSIATGRRGTTATSGGPTAAVRTGKACGIQVNDTRIVESTGRTLYREPGPWTADHPHPSVVRCSGSSAWVVWDNGAAMNQEGYVGAHSTDGGHSWSLVFAEGYFGVNAQHQLDSYLGPWTLVGPHVAYFTGWCPACGTGPAFGTDSLAVTRDDGRTFKEYKIPGLNGYMPVRLRVSGREATIWGKRVARGVPPRKTVTLHIG
jgi:hypothetical protein